MMLTCSPESRVNRILVFLKDFNNAHIGTDSEKGKGVIGEHMEAQRFTKTVGLIAVLDIN